jgi:hypothetical protein
VAFLDEHVVGNVLVCDPCVRKFSAWKVVAGQLALDAILRELSPPHMSVTRASWC